MMKLFELDLDLGPTCRIHLAKAKLAPPPCALTLYRECLIVCHGMVVN